MSERERAAELMRLTLGVGRTHDGECWRVVGHHGCAIARAEVLLAERDALREDTARLDWLGDDPGARFNFVWQLWDGTTANAFRAAIDAARGVAASGDVGAP